MTPVTDNPTVVADRGEKPSPPTEPPDSDTGGGGALQHATLSGMQTLRAAISQGWAIKPEYLKLMPGILANIAVTAKSLRERRQAIRTLAAMHASNVKQAEVLDKMNRLDDGQPTEVVELKPITLRTVEKIQ